MVMKIVNNFLRLFLIVFGFCGLYFVKDMNILLSLIITFPCLFLLALVPEIIYKIFKYRMSDGFICFYLIFMILALEVGSLYNVYHVVWWYDLFTHFLSGIFMSLVGVIILEENKVSFKKHKLFYITFIICFSLAIAGIWEICEFSADSLVGSDTQFVKETGVSDTMEDMIIAFVGSILTAIYFYIKRKKSINN